MWTFRGNKICLRWREVHYSGVASPRETCGIPQTHVKTTLGILFLVQTRIRSEMSPCKRDPNKYVFALRFLLKNKIQVTYRPIVFGSFPFFLWNLPGLRASISIITNHIITCEGLFLFQFKLKFLESDDFKQAKRINLNSEASFFIKTCCYVY